MKRKIKFLEIVLKITERCNINCTYCYMFNNHNSDYLDHPAYINEDVISDTINWLDTALDELDIGTLTIILHGGEPLMLKPERFDALCSSFVTKLGKRTRLRMSVQTNAALVNNRWIEIFAKHKITVGVSLDGPRELNDRVRVDHQGRGTYDDTVRGLRIVQRASRHDLTNAPGIICVADPKQDGGKIYRHFVDDLGIKSMSFLIPMGSHDYFSEEASNGLANYYEAILREWQKDADPYIEIRMFNNFLRFLGAPGTRKPSNIYEEPDTVILAVASNGDLSINDELKVINFGQAIGNVKSLPLSQYIEHSVHQYVEKIWRTVPESCGGCPWVGYCRGGAQNQVISNRYSEARGFNNPSVFCLALSATYKRLTEFFISSGAPVTRIADRLYEARQSITVGDLDDISHHYIRSRYIPLKALS